MINPEFPEETSGRVSVRTLREFAGLCLAIFGGLFALSWYRHQHAPNPAGWIAGSLAVLVGVPGLIWPEAIRPVYVGVTALTRPIGHVFGLVLLAVVYYGVMTPLAVAFRMVGRDGLGRYRPKSETYWVDRLPSPDVRLYLRQYQRQVSTRRTSSAPPAPSVPARIPAPAFIPPVSQPQPQALSGVDHGAN